MKEPESANGRECTTGFSSGHILVADCDGLSESVKGGSFEHNQLEPGRLRASLMRVQLPESVLDSGVYDRRLRIFGGMPRDQYTLGLVLPSGGTTSLNGHPVTGAAPACLGPGSELEAVFSAGIHWFGLTISGNKLRETADLARDRLRNRNGPDSGIFEAGKDVGLLSRQLLRMFKLGVRPGPIPHPNELEEELLFGFLDLVSLDATPRRISPWNRYRVARRAEDYLRAQLGEPVLLSELCRYVGTSRRHLEHCFRDVFGMGPAAFLRKLRLNEAHRLLAARTVESSSVTETALEVGLTHLGRFSTDYRRMFGEYPRETLNLCPLVT